MFSGPIEHVAGTRIFGRPTGDAFGLSRHLQPEQATLAVHRVGSFEASFVPTLSDFGRLDPRFRLPAHVWDGLPAYADHGFGVFALRDDRSWWAKHPMAFEFPTRSPDRAFLPTVHVHDGRAHEVAQFDHTLYVQGLGGGPAVGPEEWQASASSAAGFVDIERARGLVLGEARCHRRTLVGSHPNMDVWA